MGDEYIEVCIRCGFKNTFHRLATVVRKCYNCWADASALMNPESYHKLVEKATNDYHKKEE